MRTVRTWQAVFLFRRKCRRRPTTAFRNRLVRDAVAAALDKLAAASVPHPNVLHIVFGDDDKYEKYVAIGTIVCPRYVWVRVETTVMSEDGKVPARFARGADGLIKATNI